MNKFAEQSTYKGVVNMSSQKKLSMWSVVLLVLIPTFGFGNITNNVVAIGPWPLFRHGL